MQLREFDEKYKQRRIESETARKIAKLVTVDEENVEKIAEAIRQFNTSLAAGHSITSGLRVIAVDSPDPLKTLLSTCLSRHAVFIFFCPNRCNNPPRHKGGIPAT